MIEKQESNNHNNQAEEKNQNAAKDAPETSKNASNKVVSRKIPETLVQSYDLVTIKEERKKRFNNKK